ncbi:mitochondrial fission ELM1 family protein [Brevundimonas sp. 2R-24]|uniref:Mitochondrial fission ELM1 family protein n=1 Tax=Peiella sedimenti TaxID=3061083 RepID=A0ABT8SRV2_9CAUL|nr:mitochondrial fission ELM1 family protein [Caulobacteraceae bacterium XZ-24]
MEVDPSKPLTIWAVSDGRAGIENQVLGLAQAIARLAPSEIAVKRVAWRRWADRLPSMLKIAPRRMLAKGSDPLSPPWPEVWIAAGRATLPLSINARRWSRGRTLVVQLQDPRWPTRLFDMVIPPEHDEVEGDNVFPILGSPHRVTPARLDEARARFARLAALPSPRCAVLIGGRSKVFDLSDAHAAALADQIARAVGSAGGSAMVTFSRRTPPSAAEALRARLSSLAGEVWDGVGDNPYFGYLAYADHILVTEDSTNMAVEAAATRKPVHILPLEGGAPRFARLHQALEARGVSRRFEGTLNAWSYEPLDETGRAARAVLEAMAARG